MQQRSLFDFARRPGECQSTVPSGPVGVSPPACVPPSKEREEPPTQRPRTEDYHPSPTTAPQSVDAHHHDEFTAAVEKRDPPTACSMATAFKEDVKWQISDAFQDIWPSKATDDRVPYAVIVDVLADISATTSRLECIKLLTRLFQAVAFRCPSELVATMYLVINKQGPPHEGIELGIGDSLLTKVVAECCGMTETRLKEEYKQMGDLAEIAQNNRQKQCTLMKPKPLYASGVFGALKEIAMMSGKDVMKRRADIIKRLLRDAQGAEVNFIIRALQQKMRIGLAEPSAVTALGYAFALNFVGAAYIRRSSPEHLQAALDIVSSSLARFHHEVPSIEVVVAAVLEHGPLLLVPGSTVATQQELTLRIRPGLPVKPQLAHPTSGINVILNRFEGHVFTSEYKYDGERAQIHYQRGRGYFIYSRNSETHTGKYPDVVSAFPSFFDDASVESFIIDSEIVAVNPETGALQAFQVLQHRGRKNISEKDVTIPVCVFAFDILFFNGEPQLSKSLSERREMLWSHFKPTHGKLAFATHLDTDNVEDIQRFLDQSIADGCEGLMVKTLHEDATYTPAKRSHYWLKLKKDYMDGVTDTLDLVPIAAFYGKGKRTGVFGGFLLACYDPETDEYQSICKIGTGFQDEVLEQLTRSLKPFAATEKPRYYRCEEEGPDVWLTESQVWEVKAADLSISPVHFAAIGQVDPSKGIALRFPRYIRTREDKKPVDSTSAQQVADMYRAQSLAIRQVEAESEED